MANAMLMKTWHTFIHSIHKKKSPVILLPGLKPLSHHREGPQPDTWHEHLNKSPFSRCHRATYWPPPPCRPDRSVSRAARAKAATSKGRKCSGAPSGTDDGWPLACTHSLGREDGRGCTWLMVGRVLGAAWPRGKINGVKVGWTMFKAFTKCIVLNALTELFPKTGWLSREDFIKVVDGSAK